MHKIEVPREFAAVDELIVPTSYKAMSNDDPAFALFVFYLQAGLVEVLPQKWFTAAQYRVGQQWITRAARDPESHHIFGECFGVGTFLLEEAGAGWRSGWTDGLSLGIRRLFGSLGHFWIWGGITRATILRRLQTAAPGRDSRSLKFNFLRVDEAVSPSPPYTSEIERCGTP